MANSCKYYKQKKQFSTNSGQTWQDVTPFEYRMGSIIEPDSPDCQIEIKITRFITMPDAFLCDGKDKYEKQVAQYSLDDGATWQYYYPSIYQLGNLIETNADICVNKWEGYYSGNTANICSAGYTYVAGRGCVKNSSSSSSHSCPIGQHWNATIGSCTRGVSNHRIGTDPVKYIRCSTSTSTTLTRTDITYNPYTLYEGFVGDCVTEISAYTFSQCSALTDINIADGVTTIGELAFFNCRSLTGVTIPNSVISIGESAFAFVPWWAAYSANTDNHYGNIIYINNLAVEAVNYNITECTFKENTISINNNAFWGCNYLTGITIPDSVTIIGQKAFYECSHLTSVTIPNSVTSIGNEAFRGCYGLTSINIPSGITSIGSSVFYNCRSLTSVTIPNSVTSIGSSAFYECRSLTSVTIPNSVTSIGGSAFYNCSGLTNITIPDSLTTIGDSTFSYCRSLTSVTIPDSVTSIGGNAFSYCTGLTSITIPDNVASIGNYAFYGCSGLTSITINATTPPTIGSDVFRNTHNCPIYVPCESVNAYKSASGWSSYSSRIQCLSNEPKWFATYVGGTITSGRCDGTSAITQNEIDLTDLTSVEIKDCVNTLGFRAFKQATSLTSVTMTDNVTLISGETFAACTALTSVNLSTGLTAISGSSFQNCPSLTSVTIPASVQRIGSRVFERCSGLTRVTVLATTPPSLASYVFDDTNDCPIIVPCDSVNTYKSASGWSTYASRIVGNCPKWTATYSDSHTESAQCGSSSAITNNEITKSGLTSVEIGDCVTSIGQNVFSGCTSLTSITIPNSVTSIGYNAFYNCSGLTSVTIPSGVTTIEAWTFYNCDGLTSITIPSGVTSIGTSAFMSCSNIEDITIPNTVTSIGTYAFSSCISLQTVTLPNSITTLPDSTFRECDNLAMINSENIGEFNIPSGVITLGYGLFTSCYALQYLIIPSTVTTIEKNILQGCRNVVIECNAVNPPALTDTLGGSIAQIRVPSASVEAYKSASGWSQYANKIYPN